MKMKKLYAIAALSSAILSIPANAAVQTEEGAYLGASLGYNTLRYDTSKPSEYSNNTKKEESKGKVGGKAYVGYQFNENFSGELAYHYLNNYKVSYKDKLGNITLNHCDASLRRQAFSVAAVARLPLGTEQTSAIFGKLGGALVHYNFEFTEHKSLSNPTAFRISDKTNKGALFLGAGAEFMMDKNLVLRAEYEHFFPGSSKQMIKTENFGVWSIGLRVKFQ